MVFFTFFGHSMDVQQFNYFCASLRASMHTVQWRGAHVWKVGGKVFSIGRWTRSKHSGITCKVAPLSYDILKNEPGWRPAPYFASRGMKWIQYYGSTDFSLDDLKLYLQESHFIVAKSLTKKKRDKLGLSGLQK